jgi:hypothetical protein
MKYSLDEIREIWREQPAARRVRALKWMKVERLQLIAIRRMLGDEYLRRKANPSWKS